jgi:hypothetical protein
MPSNNGKRRRAQRQEAADERRINALVSSEHPLERLLGTVAKLTQQDARALRVIETNESSRLCDECRLPRFECELLEQQEAEAGRESHIFSPMPATQQLEIMRGENMQNQHFAGANHPSDCLMAPAVCYINAGIPGN